MYLFILGFIFVVGLFIVYLLSTSSGKKGDNEQQSDLEQDDNVIFLPKDLEKEKQKHKKK